MVGVGREAMWDSKAWAEGISWIVDMFVLVNWWFGDVVEDVWKIWKREENR